jgi:hypothetical protein
MSYWCGFEIEEDNSINMTSNVAPMWRLAGADLAELSGKPAAEVQLVLANAIRNMLSEPHKYKVLNPANGWGDYKSCVVYLVNLAILCTEVGATDLFYAHH